MPYSDADLKERIIKLISEVPVDGISENMIYWTLTEENWNITRADIERATTSLFEDGRIELTGEIQGYRRYRIKGSEDHPE